MIYKLRLFFKPIINTRTALGKITIINGSFEYCLKMIKLNEKKISKIILEIKE